MATQIYTSSIGLLSPSIPTLESPLVKAWSSANVQVSLLHNTFRHNHQSWAGLDL